MSEKPPPLPDLEAFEAPVKTVEVRLAPPPAPLLWRTLAFLVDTSVIGLLGLLITTRLLIPDSKPDELALFYSWKDEIGALITRFGEAAEAGDLTLATSLQNQAAEKIRDMPAGVRDLAVYFSNSMTIIYWLGFAGMEIATRGASLGKRIFRLRTAAFPHGERPGILDSLLRSGWKAMSISSAGWLVMLFAVVDAHWPLFNPLRRSLHDVMCRTIVLDARFDPPEEPRKDEAQDEE